ncbi:MAG: hypothetical protein WC526_01050 [Patescibacteria group bacterium]
MGMRAKDWEAAQAVFLKEAGADPDPDDSWTVVRSPSLQELLLAKEQEFPVELELSDGRKMTVFVEDIKDPDAHGEVEVYVMYVANGNRRRRYLHFTPDVYEPRVNVYPEPKESVG